MPKFVKKPIEIEARQWDGRIDTATQIIDWILSEGGTARYFDGGLLRIDTLEGTMSAEADYWIIRGVKGEFYPCKPDIFEATYELVEA